VLEGQYPEAQGERPVVGSRWSRIVDRALARAPADRYADAGAMKAALQAELERLGIAEPEHELEAWLDEPATYAGAHEKRMIDKLVALGEEARTTAPSRTPRATPSSCASSPG
jgi:serine/threonine-protein kinase